MLHVYALRPSGPMRSFATEGGRDGSGRGAPTGAPKRPVGRGAAAAPPNAATSAGRPGAGRGAIDGARRAFEQRMGFQDLGDKVPPPSPGPSAGASERPFGAYDGSMSGGGGGRGGRGGAGAGERTSSGTGSSAGRFDSGFAGRGGRGRGAGAGAGAGGERGGRGGGGGGGGERGGRGGGAHVSGAGRAVQPRDGPTRPTSPGLPTDPKRRSAADVLNAPVHNQWVPGRNLRERAETVPAAGRDMPLEAAFRNSDAGAPPQYRDPSNRFAQPGAAMFRPGVLEALETVKRMDREITQLEADDPAMDDDDMDMDMPMDDPVADEPDVDDESVFDDDQRSDLVKERENKRTKLEMGRNKQQQRELQRERGVIAGKKKMLRENERERRGQTLRSISDDDPEVDSGDFVRFALEEKARLSEEAELKRAQRAARGGRGGFAGRHPDEALDSDDAAIHSAVSRGGRGGRGGRGDRANRDDDEEFDEETSEFDSEEGGEVDTIETEAASVRHEMFVEGPYGEMVLTESEERATLDRIVASRRAARRRIPAEQMKAILAQNKEKKAIEKKAKAAEKAKAQAAAAASQAGLKKLSVSSGATIDYDGDEVEEIPRMHSSLQYRLPHHQGKKITQAEFDEYATAMAAEWTTAMRLNPWWRDADKARASKMIADFFVVPPSEAPFLFVSSTKK